MWFSLSKNIDIEKVHLGLVVKNNKSLILYGKGDPFEIYKRLGRIKPIFGSQICRSILFEEKDQFGSDLLYQNVYYPIGTSKEDYQETDPNFQIEHNISLYPLFETLDLPMSMSLNKLEHYYRTIVSKKWLEKHQDYFDLEGNNPLKLEKELYYQLFLMSSHAKEPSKLEPHYQLIKKR